MNRQTSQPSTQLTALKPYEYWQTITESIRAHIVTGISLLGCSACLSGLAVAKAPQIDFALATAGLSFATIGRLAGKTSEERRWISNDWQDVSDASRTTDLALQMSPRQVSKVLQESSIVPQVPQAFDWMELSKNRNKYPHLILLGKTGGGKSTLAEKLADLLGGKVLVVAPHFQRGDYQTASLVIGSGRNYGESALPYSDEPEKGKSQNTDPELDFRDILAGKVKPTVCQFVSSLGAEMTRRYELVDPTSGCPSSDGVYRYVYEGSEILNIILDEFNAYAKLPGVAKLFKALIRESRKVGLRLIILAQGSEVAALGIEGEGSLRESLTYIWLSPFVHDEAKRIRNSKKDDQEIANWDAIIKLLEAQRYPLMVEDKFAYSPVDDEFLNRAIAPPKFELDSRQAQPNGLDGQLDGNSRKLGNVETPVRMEANNSNAVQVYNTVEANPEVREALEMTKKLAWNAAREAANRPNSPLKKSEIIKQVWGLKAERYSNKGIPLWDEIEEKYGAIYDTK